MTEAARNYKVEVTKTIGKVRIESTEFGPGIKPRQTTDIYNGWEDAERKLGRSSTAWFTLHFFQMSAGAFSILGPGLSFLNTENPSSLKVIPIAASLAILFFFTAKLSEEEMDKVDYKTKTMQQTRRGNGTNDEKIFAL